MTAQTTSARQVARLVSKAIGREVTDKRVRAWVRENVTAFDDDGYTTHAYDARTVKAIVKGMTERYSGGKGTTARATSASNGRQGTPKAPKARKVTPSADAAPDATPDA